MDSVTIPKHIYGEVINHCREGYPNEVCGILAGKGTEVSRIYKMRNLEPSPVSYMMDPAEQFDVVKEMRQQNLSMVAIYHSHPSAVAYPSQKDVNLAFYNEAVYVIVGLLKSEAEVRAFSIEEGRVYERAIIIREEP